MELLRSYGSRTRSACHRAHVRKSAGKRGSLRLRGKRAEKFSRQSCANLHLQHGDATLRCRSDSRRRSSLWPQRGCGAGPSCASGCGFARWAGCARSAHLERARATLSRCFLASNEAALHVAAQLQAGGFAVKAIRPPTVPAGTARIRLSLTCKITLEDVRRLVSAIGAAVESAPNRRQRRRCLPCMPERFFITGTDTGVGKTVVSALLCAALDAIYWKPIQTGAREGTDRQAVVQLAQLPRERHNSRNLPLCSAGFAASRFPARGGPNRTAEDSNAAHRATR